MLEDLEGKPGAILVVGVLRYSYQEERGPLPSNTSNSYW